MTINDNFYDSFLIRKTVCPFSLLILVSAIFTEGSIQSKMPSRPKTSGERAEMELRANAAK
jgi:hypothetical protein